MNIVERRITTAADSAIVSFKKKRLAATMPVCRLLSRLRVKPRHVTIFRGLLFVPFFFLWIYHYYPASITVLALSIILDAIDGDLSRMHQPDSDLGKFEDIMVDNVMVVVLPLALIYDGLVSGFLGAYNEKTAERAISAPVKTSTRQKA